jgi:hypothetical protein
MLAMLPVVRCRRQRDVATSLPQIGGRYFAYLTCVKLVELPGIEPAT